MVIGGECELGSLEQVLGSVGICMGCGKARGMRWGVRQLEGGLRAGVTALRSGQEGALWPQWFAFGSECGAGPGVRGEFGMKIGSMLRVASQGLGLGVQGAAWAQTGNHNIPGYEAQRASHYKAWQVSDPLF